ADAPPGESILAFTARSMAPKQRVSIFVNEKPLGSQDVDVKKQRYRATIPAGVLKLGENRVRFTFRSAGGAAMGGKRSAAAFYDVTLGPSGGQPPEPTAASVREVSLGGAKKRAIAVPGKTSRISYYVAVPEGASLAFAYGCEGAGAHVAAAVAVDGQKRRSLLDAACDGNKWTEASLPLGAAGGRAARI